MLRKLNFLSICLTVLVAFLLLAGHAPLVFAADLTAAAIDVDIFYDTVWRTYNAETFALSGSDIGFWASGLVEGHYATASVSGRNAGSYVPVIRIWNEDGADVTEEYNIRGRDKPGLSIAAYSGRVVVNVDNKTKNYNTGDPRFTVSVYGTCRGESIDCSISRQPGEGAGVYTISASTSNTNYANIDFVSGTLTIRPAVVYSYSGKVPEKAPQEPPATFADFGERITVRSAPTLEGYRFSGWSTSDASVSNGSFALSSSGRVNTVTFKGTWTARRYDITWHLDGEEYTTSRFGTDEKIQAIADPVKEGYEFLGWKNLPESMPAHSINIYGTFSPIPYKVTWVLNDEVYEEETFTIGQPITRLKDPETENGFLFSGWDYDKIPAAMDTKEYTIRGAIYQVVLIDEKDAILPGHVTLINILFAVLSAGSIIAVMIQSIHRGFALSMLTVLHSFPAICAVILLFFTTDFFGGIVIADIWTILFGVILAIQLFFAYRMMHLSSSIVYEEPNELEELFAPDRKRLPQL